MGLPHIKLVRRALAGGAQWIEHQPENQRVSGWFPVRAHAWLAGQVLSAGARERQPHIDVSLPLSPSLPLSLKINK